MRKHTSIQIRKAIHVDDDTNFPNDHNNSSINLLICVTLTLITRNFIRIHHINRILLVLDDKTIICRTRFISRICQLLNIIWMLLRLVLKSSADPSTDFWLSHLALHFFVRKMQHHLVLYSLHFTKHSIFMETTSEMYNVNVPLKCTKSKSP